MQACNFPKQSDRVECRCSQAGIVQREPEFSFDRDSELLVRIPFHHESSVPEVPSASVGPDHRGRNSAGHRHAGHYPRHHGARGAEKGTQLESITSWGEIRCRFIFSGKNDEPTPDFPLSGKTKAAAEGKATSTGKKLGRPREEPTAPVTGQPRGRKSNRSLALNELEAEIDRLIFKVMGVGDLTEIEAALRRARRLLYVTANGR